VQYSTYCGKNCSIAYLFMCKWKIVGKNSLKYLEYLIYFMYCRLENFSAYLTGHCLTKSSSASRIYRLGTYISSENTPCSLSPARPSLLDLGMTFRMTFGWPLHAVLTSTRLAVSKRRLVTWPYLSAPVFVPPIFPGSACPPFRVPAAAFPALTPGLSWLIRPSARLSSSLTYSPVNLFTGEEYSSSCSDGKNAACRLSPGRPLYATVSFIRPSMYLQSTLTLEKFQRRAPSTWT
jgi:hypothetical protein